MTLDDFSHVLIPIGRMHAVVADQKEKSSTLHNFEIVRKTETSYVESLLLARSRIVLGLVLIGISGVDKSSEGCHSQRNL